MAQDQKCKLRRVIREASRLRDKESLVAESENIMARLESLDMFRRASVVGLYWSLDDEVATHEFVRKWSAEKTILLPVVEGDNISFRRFASCEQMRVGEFNICEPEGDDDESQMDIIVVPGAAFDPDGHRMGRGRGYYDRFLDNHRSVFKVGVCFCYQLVDSVPSEKHDIAMDMVLTSDSFSH